VSLVREPELTVVALVHRAMRVISRRCALDQFHQQARPQHHLLQEAEVSLAAMAAAAISAVVMAAEAAVLVAGLR